MKRSRLRGILILAAGLALIAIALVVLSAESASPVQNPTEPETVTDQDGRYRFENLDHAVHKVTLDLDSLPAGLLPRPDEAPPTLWLAPGTNQTSRPLASGVSLSASYQEVGGVISGIVFQDLDRNGRWDPGDPGIPNVRVIDPGLHQYFVPFDDADLWTLFVGKNQCHAYTPLLDPRLPIVSSIWVTSGSDGSVFYYDHWEDGYDVDPLVPGASTEMGMLDAGATKLFESDIDTANLGSGPPYYYDGRDRISILGDPATVIRMAYPSYVYVDSTPNDGVISAAAWEVSDVANWGTRYVATVGEDLDVNGSTMVDDHDYSGLEVMAWQDDTIVYHNGSQVATLAAGEVYFVAGANDGAAGDGIDSGDEITASNPVQVQMITGSCDGAGVSVHGYTLQPASRWDNVYWAPVPGFTNDDNYCPLANDIDSDIYLVNPHASDITVTADDGTSPVDVIIPSNSTISLLEAANWGDISSGSQGIRLSSDSTFWGLAVIDSSSADSTTDAATHDWSYSLMPESQLSSQVMVGYSPGTGDGTPGDNSNLAWVTAITDTVIYVDLNQDHLADNFDMNADGDSSDFDVLGTVTWDEPLSALGIPLSAGQVLRVGDPNDQDLMGALIYTADPAERIAVAWGQDPCHALTGSPSLDLGYTILPLPATTIYKDDALAVDADQTGDISAGDTLTYTINIVNKGQGSMNDAILTDTLPYTYTTFVPGSLAVTEPPTIDTIEYYNGSTWATADSSDTIAFRVLWDTIGPGQQMTITFRAQLTATLPASLTEITNQATLNSANTPPYTSTDPEDPPDPDTDTPIRRPELTISKQAAPPAVAPGERVTYTVVVQNSGNGVATGVEIDDLLPGGMTLVNNSLDQSWPVSLLQVTTNTVTRDYFYDGNYSDDFDLDAAQSTYFSGSDGTLDWSGDWSEVNDDNNSATGSVRILVDAATALSGSSYLYLTDTNGADSGLERQLDLSDFSAPVLRYYLYGDVDHWKDTISVVVNGTTCANESYYGNWVVRELDLSAYAGLSSVTVGFMASANLKTNDHYRIDYISIYESDPARSGTETVTSEYTTLSQRSSTGGSPLSYDLGGGQMVITNNLTLPAGGVITVTYEGLVSASSGVLVNTACTTATNWLTNNSTQCATALVTASPTAVGLASFYAEGTADAAILHWETASETDNIGFDLYRSESLDGSQILLNPQLIPSQSPGGLIGASYLYTDRTVKPGRTYYYWLEDIAVGDLRTRHGPVSVTISYRLLFLPLLQK